MAHRLWDVPDIVEEICSWIDTFQLYDHGNPGYLIAEDRMYRNHIFAIMARTARLFFIPAARRIWAHVNTRALNHLLTAIFVKPSLLRWREGDIQRYLFYERCIRELVVDANQDSEELSNLISLYLHLMSGTRTNWTRPFPNLTSLRFRKCSWPTVMDDRFPQRISSYTAALTLATLALQSGLRKVRYTFNLINLDAVEDETITFLQAIPGRCPTLRSLELSFAKLNSKSQDEGIDIDGSPRWFVAALPDIVSRLPALTNLSIGPRGPLSPAFMKVLGTHRALSKLAVDYFLEDWLSDPSFEEVTRDIGPRTDLASLRQLHLSGTMKGISSMLPDPDREGYSYTTGVEYLSFLESLKLQLQYGKVERTSPLSLRTLLRRLRYCRRITHLELDLHFREPLADEDVELLATTFLALECLAFRHVPLERNEDDNPTDLTARSLVALATFCPKLRYLALYFPNLDDLDAPSTFIPTDASVTLYLVSYEPFRDVALYKFLRRLWPKTTAQFEAHRRVRSGELSISRAEQFFPEMPAYEPR